MNHESVARIVRARPTPWVLLALVTTLLLTAVISPGVFRPQRTVEAVSVDSPGSAPPSGIALETQIGLEAKEALVNVGAAPHTSVQLVDLESLTKVTPADGHYIVAATCIHLGDSRAGDGVSVSADLTVVLGAINTLVPASAETIRKSGSDWSDALNQLIGCDLFSGDGGRLPTGTKGVLDSSSAELLLGPKPLPPIDRASTFAFYSDGIVIADRYWKRGHIATSPGFSSARGGPLTLTVDGEAAVYVTASEVVWISLRDLKAHRIACEACKLPTYGPGPQPRHNSVLMFQTETGRVLQIDLAQPNPTITDLSFPGMSVDQKSLLGARGNATLWWDAATESVQFHDGDRPRTLDQLKGNYGVPQTPTMATQPNNAAFSADGRQAILPSRQPRCAADKAIVIDLATGSTSESAPAAQAAGGWTAGTISEVSWDPIGPIVRYLPSSCSAGSASNDEARYMRREGNVWVPYVPPAETRLGDGVYFERGVVAAESKVFGDDFVWFPRAQQVTLLPHP